MRTLWTKMKHDGLMEAYSADFHFINTPKILHILVHSLSPTMETVRGLNALEEWIGHSGKYLLMRIKIQYLLLSVTWDLISPQNCTNCNDTAENVCTRQKMKISISQKFPFLLYWGCIPLYSDGDCSVCYFVQTTCISCALLWKIMLITIQLMKIHVSFENKCRKISLGKLYTFQE